MAGTPKANRAIANSERKPAAGAAKIGDADPKEKLSVSVRVRRRTDGPPIDLNKLAVTPYRERKHLSREEYASSYGAAQADLDQVAAFARSQGLAVVESSIQRLTVVLSGTVAQVSLAFGVQMNATRLRRKPTAASRAQ
jgi:kumamolisin